MSTTADILQRVEALNATSKALTTEPIRTRIKALGLLRSPRVLCGPLRLPSGEVWLRVTDDGPELLSN